MSYFDYVLSGSTASLPNFTIMFVLFLPSGTSSLSQPIMFTTAGQESDTAAAPVSTSGTASAVGVAVACILVAAILLSGGMYYRYKKVS